MPSKGHHLLMGHRLHRRLCRWRLNTRGARNSSPIRPPSVHFTVATAAQSAEFVPRPPRRAPRRLSLLIARRARTSAPHPPLPMCTSPRRPPRSASSLSPVGHTDHPVVRRSSSRAERANHPPSVPLVPAHPPSAHPCVAAQRAQNAQSIPPSTPPRVHFIAQTTPRVHFTAATAAQREHVILPSVPMSAPPAAPPYVAPQRAPSTYFIPLPAPPNVHFTAATTAQRGQFVPLCHTDHPVVRRSSSRAERALRDPGSSAGTLSAHFIPRPPHLSRRPPSRASLLVVHRADRIPQPLCAQRRAALLMLRRTSRAQRLHRFLFN